MFVFQGLLLYLVPKKPSPPVDRPGAHEQRQDLIEERPRSKAPGTWRHCGCPRTGSTPAGGWFWGFTFQTPNETLGFFSLSDVFHVDECIFRRLYWGIVQNHWGMGFIASPTRNPDFVFPESPHLKKNSPCVFYVFSMCFLSVPKHHPEIGRRGHLTPVKSSMLSCWKIPWDLEFQDILFSPN